MAPRLKAGACSCNRRQDGLPQIEGLTERWGKSAFHCPYCHGYELNQGEIAVIAASPMSIHQAQLIPEWGKVTFFTNGIVTPDAEARADLERRGVTIDETPVARLEGHVDVVLTDGRRLPFAGLFVATRTTPASDIAERFGCEIEETPMGLQIRATAAKKPPFPAPMPAATSAAFPTPSRLPSATAPGPARNCTARWCSDRRHT